MWLSAEELGVDPRGFASAHPASFRQVPSGGFVAVVLPFFADAFLPEERGTYDQVAGSVRLHPPPPLRVV